MKEVFLGMDMGGTRIKMALVQKDGQLLKLDTQDARADLNMQQRLEELVEVINDLVGKENMLKGIGIAFPGIVDSHNGRILSEYVKYPDAHKADIRAWASRHWNVPLVLENDARAALVGEWQYGAGQGNDSLLMVTLGTGMGSAVLMEGKLLRGKNHLAGNLGGHMSIDFEGDPCNCGNRGCVETAGSTWALKNNFRKIPGFQNSSLFRAGILNFELIFDAARQGDEVAGKLKVRSLDAWSAALINLLHAFDPEKVIIGGGIMESKDEIIPFIEQRIRERSWLPEGVPIVSASQTTHAGILGVCYLLKELNAK